MAGTPDQEGFRTETDIAAEESRDLGYHDGDNVYNSMPFAHPGSNEGVVYNPPEKR